MIRSIIASCALVLLATACPKGEPPAEKTNEIATQPPPVTERIPKPELSGNELIVRGQEIFTGTDYSDTGLTCAMCHSSAPSMDEGKIYIASAAYIAARRRTPAAPAEVTGDEMPALEEDNASVLVDSTNKCITAPYMNHPAGMSEDDAKAMVAFLESIYTQTSGQDPFVAHDQYNMPAAGLTPDREHGKLVYETSCRFCHDNGVKGMPSLAGAKDWLTPIQVMAKVRKVQGDWFNDFNGQSYACADPLARQLAWLGIGTACAQEAEAVPPHSEGAAGMEPPAEQEGQEEHAEDMIFPENAMPGYAPEILSDQDVVDVAFYVAEEM